jgi:hypothetical protein
MFTFINHNSPLPGAAPSVQRTAGDMSEIAKLRADIDRLYFITEGLWRILREKHGLDDQEIIRQIAAIDLEDGKLDGRKSASPPKPCPKCSRVLSKQRPSCMFCGEFIALDPFDR